MTKKVFALFFAFSITMISQGQFVVTGVVTDACNQPTPMVTITLVKAASGMILSFATTNKKGEYTISYQTHFLKDSFAVQLQSFGYAKQKTLLYASSQLLNFTLQPSVTELPKVTVQNKPKPIRAQGDTIIYRVENFSNPTDRVIGDVIKKLPGVEMNADGKITYQGKAISRFYIDGDNLLDDKYNIATNSVPSNMIVSIQILDKHQPIKALENVQYTDVPAMNIITKESARKTLINDGNAAVGDPGLYDITLHTLLFGKNLKFINYLKLNNTGAELTKDIISHNTADNQKKIDNHPPPDLLSIQLAGTPALAKKRWLFNKSGLLNINDLVNLSKGVQLRVNAYYLSDKQYQTYRNNTSFYLATDTIRYIENQTSIHKDNTLRTQFNLTINNKGYYLNNTLAIENQSIQGWAELQTNKNSYINQNITGSNTTFSNELNYMKVLANKQVIELYSYIENNTNPQTLSVEPGLYANIINQGKSYTRLTQFVSIPGFFTTNYITIRKKYGALVHTSQAGFSNQSQQLNSKINNFQTDGTIHQLADSFTNFVKWGRYKLFIQQEFDWKADRWQMTFSFPLNYQHITYQTPFTKQSDSSKQLIPFNPSVQLKLLSGKENSFMVASFIDNSLGTIDEAFKGYLFTNYRSISSNESTFSQIKNKGASVNYYFKKAIDGFFMNFGLLFISSNRNVIGNTLISDNIQQTSFIYYPNNSTYQSFTASINQYVFKWKTDIKIGFVANQQIADQLQNGKLLRYRNHHYSYKLKIDAKLPAGIYANYIAVFTKSLNQQINEIISTPNSRISATHLEQQLELSMVINKNLYVKWNTEHYFNSFPGAAKTHFLFLDANATIRINKIHSDIQVFVNNIVGNDWYSMLNLSSNIVSANNYLLRPRTLLVKFNYRF